jgi:hypothetical protein
MGGVRWSPREGCTADGPTPAIDRHALAWLPSFHACSWSSLRASDRDLAPAGPDLLVRPAGCLVLVTYISGTLTCGKSCNSDERLKKNIEPLSAAVDRLLKLRGVSFEWKNPEEHEKRTGTQVGLIAQDVEKVFPQWVRKTETGFLNVDVDPERWPR